MTMQDVLRLVFGLLGSKTASGGVRSSEVYQPPADKFTSVQGRFNFYRDFYRGLLKISILLGLTLLALVCCNAWIVFSANPQDRFFVASVDGRVQSILPLDIPGASDGDVLSRAGQALASALTFGYRDQDLRRGELAAVFAPQAIESLQQALMGDAGVAGLSAQLKSYTTAFDDSRPAVIVQKGINPQTGIYEWLVEIPLLVTAREGMDSIPKTVQPFTSRVLVQRSRAVESRYGYMIGAIIAISPEAAPQAIGGAASPPPPAAQGTTP